MGAIQGAVNSAIHSVASGIGMVEHVTEAAASNEAGKVADKASSLAADTKKAEAATVQSGKEVAKASKAYEDAQDAEASVRKKTGLKNYDKAVSNKEQATKDAQGIYHDAQVYHERNQKALRDVSDRLGAVKDLQSRMEDLRSKKSIMSNVQAIKIAKKGDK